MKIAYKFNTLNQVKSSASPLKHETGFYHLPIIALSILFGGLGLKSIKPDFGFDILPALVLFYLFRPFIHLAHSSFVITYHTYSALLLLVVVACDTLP